MTWSSVFPVNDFINFNLMLHSIEAWLHMIVSQQNIPAPDESCLSLIVFENEIFIQQLSDHQHSSTFVSITGG